MPQTLKQFYFFFILFSAIPQIQILFMGAEIQVQKQSHHQHQVIEQNYSNNIMLMAFSSLQSICRIILGKDDGNSSKKKFGKQDKVNYTRKSMSELISQFKTHLYLFRVSKQAIEIQFLKKGEFVFPKNFSKQKVLTEISTFKKICERSKDQILIFFCDDFRKIVEGDYSNLSFEKINLQQNSPENEKIDYKNDLMKQGVNAAEAMKQLSDDIQKEGITNPKDLKVAFNKPDVQYEAQAYPQAHVKK